LIPQICSNTDDTCARQLPKSWLLFSSPPESLTLSLPLLPPVHTWALNQARTCSQLHFILWIFIWPAGTA
jgi:hypothetical protein